MPHRFDTVPRANIQRSSFNLSHGYKTTFDAGKLIPFFMMDVIPGDTVNLSATSLVRLATPIVPLMDNIYFDTFFFFVPYRLVWNNFIKMMGEREDPDDSIDYLVPQMHTAAKIQSTGDYLGLPYDKAVYYSALPFRAICAIWNEWFRDENLQDSIKIDKSDTGAYYTGSLPNNFTDLLSANGLLPRGKRKDYFTSALPWPQKGNSVDIPLGTSAPVVGPSPIQFKTVGDTGNWHNLSVGTASIPNVRWNGTTTQTGEAAVLQYHSGLEVDLTNATAATINTLRQAFQIQRLLEKDALGGTRYRELLRMHFGVSSPDARLQIPEYLGGASTPFNINPIAQTSSTDTTTPQGNLSAFGLAGANGHAFTKSFVEHGLIIGLCSVRADLSYQQGLDRYWSKRTRYDFYWPTLAHLGEQAVLNKEIFAQATDDDEGVFGYQERYAEYRFMNNQITGKFRSTYSQPLDTWHLGQKFDSLPTLSNSFIQEDPPIDRVIAVPSEPQFLLDTWFNVSAVRPMPVFGTPGMIDHF